MAGESTEQAGWMLTGLAPGSLVGGYRIESRLGAGGMAVVFRARDEGLDRTVALKVLAPGLAEDAEFRERFVRESRAAARVDHPHIIPVHAAGETDGALYLAMRYVPGGDLRSVIAREGPLAGERAAFLLSPIASALDAAHATGLVHRDVKPANILIDTSAGRPDHPYLSDFGLAKGASSAPGLTESGQFLGTPGYAAPEQISGKPAGPRADQYALACVAFTALTGTLPFARDTSMAVLWAHMYDPPPTVYARRRDLPPAVDGVLARALAKAPGERYASCGEFTDTLRIALGLAPDAGSRPSPAGAGRAVTGGFFPAGAPAGPASPPAPTQPAAEPRPSLPSTADLSSPGWPAPAAGPARRPTSPARPLAGPGNQRRPARQAPGLGGPASEARASRATAGVTAPPRGGLGGLFASRRPALLVGGGAAVAVAAVIAVLALPGGNSPSSPPAHPATRSAAAHSPAPSRPAARAAATSQASSVSGAQLDDAQAGLAYEQLPAPWQGASCPLSSDNGVFPWTAGEYAAAGQVYGGPTTWYGEACSGLLPISFGYGSVAELQSTTENLAQTFSNAYYGALSHTVKTGQDAPIQVSRHAAWEVTYDVAYSNAAAQRLTWTEEQAAVVVVDNGSAQPVVFFASVPSNLNEENVSKLVSSLKLTAAKKALR